MKKTFILAFAAATLFVSCQVSAGDKTATNSQQEVAEQKGTTYILDQDQSSLKWTGYHKGGFDPRFGTLKTEGTVAVENNAITGGSITIDITSVATDEKSIDLAKTGGKTAANLDEHLKNEDFFQSDKFPTAKFEITSVAAFDKANDKSVIEGATNVISGNLTIKDKTVNVTFPAKVDITADTVHVVSKFTINRQDWGLTYGTDGDPKDWVISQEIDIELNIHAKK